MTTLATLPTYPVPEREARLVFTLTGTGSNYVRVWVVIAPEGSELAAKIKESTRSRFEVYAGDAGEAQPYRFTADKGGKYTFLAQEYTKGTGFGGGYEGDPLGAKTETKVGDETELALEIGQRMTQQIGVSPDSATLVVWVWADTLRKTTAAIHGEDSPRIENASTPRAQGAAVSGDLVMGTGVIASLRDLADVTCATALGDPATIVGSPTGMLVRLNAHNAMTGGVHNSADADNAIMAEYAAAPTPQTLIEFVNAALQAMRHHRLNDHGGAGVTPPGTGSAAYHIVGTRKADLLNMPLYTSVGSQEEAYGALADIWRAHEGHRVSTEVHGTADSTNTLTALPPILEVHRRFLTELASVDSLPPAGWQSGVHELVRWAGGRLAS